MHFPLMPRYFFNISNDEEIPDEEGSEIADDSAAIEWARREVRYWAAESVKKHAHLVLHHKITVTNEEGAEVATVRFGDIISVRD